MSCNEVTDAKNYLIGYRSEIETMQAQLREQWDTFHDALSDVSRLNLQFANGAELGLKLLSVSRTVRKLVGTNAVDQLAKSAKASKRTAKSLRQVVVYRRNRLEPALKQVRLEQAAAGKATRSAAGRLGGTTTAYRRYGRQALGTSATKLAGKVGSGVSKHYAAPRVGRVENLPPSDAAFQELLTTYRDMEQKITAVYRDPGILNTIDAIMEAISLLEPTTWGSKLVNAFKSSAEAGFDQIGIKFARKYAKSMNELNREKRRIDEALLALEFIDESVPRS